MATNRQFDEWLSDNDSLIWTIEKDPILRSTIVALGHLDRVPDHDHVRANLERAVRLIPRLRQVVEVPPLRLGPPRWVEDPEFDLDFHFRWIRLPEHLPGHDLRNATRLAAMAAFDKSRPLWEFTIIEDAGEHPAAFVMKVHHSLTDGVGGIEMAAYLFDVERMATILAAPAPEPAAAKDSRFDFAVQAAGEQVRLNARWAGRAVRGMAAFASRIVADPSGALTAAQGTARTSGKLLVPITEPGSPIMRRRSLRRDVMSIELPLAGLKAAAHAAGGTLNDAFLAGVTGGLRRYHDKHDAEVMSMWVEMPINTRRDGDGAAGNRFVPARFKVPVDGGDAAERIRSAGTVAHEWAKDPQLGVSDDLAAVLNRLPAAFTTEFFGSMLKNVDFVATNVPGSPAPLYLGGAEVTRLFPFPPTGGSACGFALLSHVDTCCIGITVDLAAVPDPEVLEACVRDSFDDVLSLAG